jgi:uncharacterized protein (TIGR00369 family)
MTARRERPSGLERLQRLMDGPGSAPLGLLLGFRLTEIGDGFAVFEGTPGVQHYNPQATVHGGWTASVLDSALGCAVETKLDPDHSYGTIELKVNYVRPLTSDTGLVTCRGEVIHSGRRMATSEARLVDRNGNLYAHGSCTCMIYEFK